MKIILNKCYGGFDFSDEMKEELTSIYGEELDWDWDDATDYRLDSNAIALIEQYGSEWANGYCAKLKIIEIPKEATDYAVEDYDGFEEIVYVLNGKLHWA